MLGRRQIREKIIQAVYSYQQNPIKTDVVEKNFFTEIDKIYNLYLYELNFLVALKRLAEEQQEIGKKKYLKTEEDLNPNLKFIRNQVLIQLEDNEERRSYTAKHKNLNWELHDDLLVKTFQRIISGKRFKDFMLENDLSFDDDQKFIGKLFLRYIAENENFYDLVEEKEISWANDFHIANSMVQKTIGFMKESQTSHTLIKVIKDDEDRSFAKKLLNDTLFHWDEGLKKVEERLQNWDLDRISLMDKVLLVTAITELDYFPFNPTRVVINEYIEIAKVFAAEKSQTFVNGVLDRYTKELNRI